MLKERGQPAEGGWTQLQWQWCTIGKPEVPDEGQIMGKIYFDMKSQHQLIIQS